MAKFAEQKVQVMSSGSLALDIALGAGGYPKDVSLKSIVLKVQVKQLLPSCCLQAQKKAVSQPLSMLNMPLTQLCSGPWC